MEEFRETLPTPRRGGNLPLRISGLPMWSPSSFVLGPTFPFGKCAFLQTETFCGLLPERPTSTGAAGLYTANENGTQGISCHFTEVNMTNSDPQETVYGKDIVLSKKGLGILFFKMKP